MQRGFSLIELMVVMLVLGVLASVALPLAEISATRRKEAELQRALWEIRDAIDGYKRAVETGVISPRPTPSGYPASLRVLVEGVAVSDARGGPSTLYFLRRIPPDPFSLVPEASPDQQWRLRSYQSSAERPRAGDDVYDVTSASDGVGLNGVPYRSW